MATKSKDYPQFTQQEREAIVDLLHLCLYADAHIGGKESQVVAKAIEAIGWDANLSFSAYEPRSIASARAARAAPENLKDFLTRAAARLVSQDSRRFAVDKCQELAASDGGDSREAELITSIKGALQC